MKVFKNKFNNDVRRQKNLFKQMRLGWPKQYGGWSGSSQ
jgi:hypothetical protein